MFLRTPGDIYRCFCGVKTGYFSWEVRPSEVIKTGILTVFFFFLAKAETQCYDTIGTENLAKIILQHKGLFSCICFFAEMSLADIQVGDWVEKLIYNQEYCC